MRQCVLEAFDNQDFQFDQMISMLNEQAVKSDTPLIQVHFSLSNTVEGQKMDDFEFAPLESNRNEIAEYGLRLEASENEGRIDVSFIYNNHLYDDYTVQLLMDYYNLILKQVLKKETMKIEDIEMESSLQHMN